MARPHHVAAIMFMLSGVLLGCAYEQRCGLGECPADAKISSNVQTRLNQYPDLGPPNQISVQTHDHVVYLSGLVSAGEQSRAAEAVAAGSPGVKRVVNTIAVAH